ncbi:chemotaxis protein CheA [Desulfomonile tiedjei]|uniref:Chemotaxis protein CheA n=1 Tax=Desulfomonile tiedjei (strain ATCC 49306 / DSM 6799 / DCB-1) TaxID=706587 RepID=I4CD02_DESTA|nr:chemotaxis protein CheA [Desulfomonile tiedjei]AFM27443.1 chemotaxis protein histidine kinase-like protein [Desulfomonile tiedjei DSM 6799]
MIDTEILQDYSSEARELLDEMENSLMRLEKEGASPELLNNIFRAVHCIKGSAEYIGLERSSTLTHGVENLLDRMREGLLSPTPEILEFLFRAKDLILTLIGEVSETQEEKTPISSVMSELESFLEGKPAPIPSISEPAPQEEEAPPAETTLSQEPEELSPVAAAEELDSAPEEEFIEPFEAQEDQTIHQFEPTEELAQKMASEIDEEEDWEVAPDSFPENVSEIVDENAEERLAAALEEPEQPTADIESTVPHLLNISLYLDDLQDGLSPDNVVSSLLETLEILSESYRALQLSEAVETLQSLEAAVLAIDLDKDALSHEEIDSLRNILYSLRSIYPEDLMVPIRESLGRTEKPEADSAPPVTEKPVTPPTYPLAAELENVPGITHEAIASLCEAGYSTVSHLYQADRDKLQNLPAMTAELATSILIHIGRETIIAQPKDIQRKKDSLLADIDDELLSEFQGLFADSGQTILQSTNKFYPYGGKAADLLQELDSIGEEADREIMEIFLSYGWEILDKLKPYVAKVKSGKVTGADLDACAELIKAIKSSSTYMDYQSLAGFLDEWYEWTIYNVQKVDAEPLEDLDFMDESLSKFEDFLGGLDMILHPPSSPELVQPRAVPEPIPEPWATRIPEVATEPVVTQTSFSPPARTDQSGQLMSDPVAEVETTAPEPVITAELEGPVDEALVRTGQDAQAGPLVRTMRVDSAKVDVLLNQVGELVVNRSYVEQLATELKNFQREIASRGDFGKKAIQQIKDLTLKVGEASISLGRVATEIQEGVMKLRMLPVGQLFNRMPRLIRDLSRRVGKTIDLEVHGGDTEVDKRVIEQIYNPLVHLIRNAVDHGIEDSDTRKKLGKKEQGSIVLSAYSQGNQVVIDVEDDGSGINADSVLKKALESKLINPQDAESVSSQEVYNLLFVPGFSTSTKVTRTSGRGVGMDVVKKDVEKINGHVEIDSWKNRGTRISLKIPLTLAIIQTLLIRSGMHVFAIPLTAVREIIQVASHEITTIEGFEVIKFRHETIPVLRVDEIFKLKEPQPANNPKFLVLASAGLKSVGFLVEELIGEQDVVIKPLADHVFKSRGLAGSTILGDGTIALVLDVLEVIEDVITKQRQLAQAHAAARNAKLERRGTHFTVRDTAIRMDV